MRLFSLLGDTVQTIFQQESSSAIVSATQAPLSVHYADRTLPVRHLVVHSFALSVPTMVQRLNDLGVSTHYLIDTQGRITQLVPEDKVAWHAGGSFWRGSTGLNATSIGIELQNATLGQTPFTKPQLDAFRLLAKDLIYRYHIAPYNIVAHSDIAPARKADVGKAFPWRDMATSGIGLWPDGSDAAIPEESIKDLLSQIGYDTTDEDKALLAFERRFMPELIPDDPDILHLEENLQQLHPVRNSEVYRRLSAVARAFRQAFDKFPQ